MNLYQDEDYTREGEENISSLEQEEYRSAFRKDYARLLHSPSFRRLQGKTQLFSGRESDFFRNRLTHSLEVAQIAKSLAIRLNHRYKIVGGKAIAFDGEISSEEGLNINLDIVEFAGLAHDLGHPPFGHQGEEALDECMISYGGFEGNAQTLRLLSTIEKKFNTPDRCGLNLAARSLASILKYDDAIPVGKDARKQYARDNGECDIKPVKGYYKSDHELVARIKERVCAGLNDGQKFKTIECSIMDVADDIAYSTYDLEDSLKAGFLTPQDFIFPKPKIVESIKVGINKSWKRNVEGDEIIDTLRTVFSQLLEPLDYLKFPTEGQDSPEFDNYLRAYADNIFKASKQLSKNGHIRTKFTSGLVGRFIRGVQLEYNDQFPQLSSVILEDSVRIQVEVLKRFTFESLIQSPRLKVAEYRGKEIVKTIFKSLSRNDGFLLLPEDVKELYIESAHEERMRIICDYIACMTDRYAIEFYGRLKSESPETIFKPH